MLVVERTRTYRIESLKYPTFRQILSTNYNELMYVVGLEEKFFEAMITKSQSLKEENEL